MESPSSKSHTKTTQIVLDLTRSSDEMRVDQQVNKPIYTVGQTVTVILLYFYDYCKSGKCGLILIIRTPLNSAMNCGRREIEPNTFSSNLLHCNSVECSIVQLITTK